MNKLLRSGQNRLPVEEVQVQVEAPSHAARLPTEILLLVFRSLSPSVYGEVFTFFVNPTFWVLGSSNDAVHFFRNLTSVCLVCRFWYGPGVDLLYSQPILASPNKLQQFLGTVKKSKFLASLVKDLIAIDQGTEPLQRTPQTRWQSLARHFLSRPIHPSRTIHSYLFCVLQCCESIQGLTIAGHWCDAGESSNRLHTRHNSLQFSQLPPHLRKLVLLQCLHHSPPDVPPFFNTDMAFSLLETLQLREVEIFPHQFPFLPHLHTLQLAQCHCENDPAKKLFISQDVFPSLTSFESYANYFVVSIDEKVFRRLLRYCSTAIPFSHGLAPWQPFELNVHAHDRPLPLQHLAMGTFSDQCVIALPHALRDQTLESLVLFFKFYPPNNGLERISTTDRQLGGLLDALIKLEVPIVGGRPPPFRSLQIGMEDSLYLHMATASNILAAIQTWCKARNIQFGLLVEGTFSFGLSTITN